MLDVEGGRVKRVAIATEGDDDEGYIVRKLDIERGNDRDIALIGYSDLP